jgi:hypothetical protein
MGRAEDLFLRIKSGGAAEVLEMIKDEVVEELFLDYKQAATAAPFKSLAHSDRKNLAKAVSGFANSEGGVIIWGVDCRHDPPRGDVPTKPHPIANPNAFKSLVEGALTGVTLPAHRGVESVVLKAKGASDGFLVTHVPVGLNVPYRTLVEKEEYFIRAGSNFLPAPHAVLAGMFGRIPHPELNLRLRLIAGSAIPPGKTCEIRIGIAAANLGRGIAEGLYLRAELRVAPRVNLYFAVNQEQWERWSTTADGRLIFTMVSSNFPPLPPGSRNDLVEMTLRIDGDVADDVTIELTCGPRNGPATARTIVFPKQLLADAVEHYTHSYGNLADRKAGDDLHGRALERCVAD